MTRLNWIHISDVHIQEKDFNRKIVLDKLWDDIRNRTNIDPALEQIDLVFFTGDLVFGGSKKEYELACTEFLDPLTRELGIEELHDRVFIVPGNHDVDRGSVWAREFNRPSLNEEDGEKAIQKLLSTPNQYAALMEPQAAYFDFFRSKFKDIKLRDPWCYYVEQVSHNGKKIAIAGLNSAWLSFDDNDDRQLLLGEQQVAAALDLYKNADLVICLFHHPFDWFNQGSPDTRRCRTCLIQDSHVILYGHMHAPNLFRLSAVEGEIHIIPAGAGFESRDELLSYNYVSLDLDTGVGTVYFRCYNDHHRKWMIGSTITGEKEGQKEIRLPLSDKKKVSLPKPIPEKVAPPRTDAPLQRPQRAIHFTGREKELEQLLTDLQPGKVVTLCGPGGIGKSALAAEAIWKLVPVDSLSERFPDGVIWHEFYARPQAALVLEHICRTYGEEPRPTPAMAAQRILARKKALLFLDGAENTDALDDVLAVRGTCGVLIASRRHQDAAGGEWQEIEPLPQKEAVKLLQSWGGDQVDNHAAAEQICERVDGLPLAVQLAGRCMVEAKESASEFLDWLKETPLEALDQGDRQKRSVPVLLKHSLEQVSSKARAVLGVVGVLASTPFARQVIERGLQKKSRWVKTGLRELVNYSLLNPQESRYQVTHNLIHTYARKYHQPKGITIGWLANHYITFAREQLAFGATGYAMLDEERAHMLVVLDACVRTKKWAAIRNLVELIDKYLNLQGHRMERIRATESELVAVQEMQDREREGNSLRKLGDAYHSLGQVEKAIVYHKQALVIAHEINHRRGESIQLGSLGNAYSTLGQREKSIKYYRQALAISQEIGDKDNEETWLGNLGIAYFRMGQIEKALDYHEKALLIAQEIGDRQAEGIGLGGLGSIYNSQGQIEKAIEQYEQALVISREIGDRSSKGVWLGNLGTIYHDLGQVKKATEYCEQALTIAQEIGDRSGEGIWLGNLGSAYRDLGQVEKAIEYCEQALVISQETSNRSSEGTQWNNLGDAYRDLEQLEKAVEHHEKALSIAREIRNRSNEGSALCDLGSDYRELNQIEKAIEYYHQALTIAREIGERQKEARYNWELGLCYKETEPTRAIELMSMRVEYEREIGHTKAEEHAAEVAQIKG